MNDEPINEKGRQEKNPREIFRTQIGRGNLEFFFRVIIMTSHIEFWQVMTSRNPIYDVPKILSYRYITRIFLPQKISSYITEVVFPPKNLDLYSITRNNFPENKYHVFLTIRRNQINFLVYGQDRKKNKKNKKKLKK